MASISTRHLEYDLELNIKLQLTLYLIINLIYLVYTWYICCHNIDVLLWLFIYIYYTEILPHKAYMSTYSKKGSSDNWTSLATFLEYINEAISRSYL